MPDIFEFNHIDKKKLSKSDIETLKDFYKHYHKTFWCFKKFYKRYKLLDETVLISGKLWNLFSDCRYYHRWNTIKPSDSWRCERCRRSCGEYWKNKELQEKD